MVMLLRVAKMTLALVRATLVPNGVRPGAGAEHVRYEDGVVDFRVSFRDRAERFSRSGAASICLMNFIAMVALVLRFTQ